jgi:hypothetical protein
MPSTHHGLLTGPALCSPPLESICPHVRIRSLRDRSLSSLLPSLVLPSLLTPRQVGYTDMPSRMAGQSSSLYANNITKLLLSAGPFTGGPKAHFAVDHADPVIR